MFTILEQTQESAILKKWALQSQVVESIIDVYSFSPWNTCGMCHEGWVAPLNSSNWIIIYVNEKNNEPDKTAAVVIWV